MSVARIWELLAKKYNDEISEEELKELELLLRQHQDAFQLNESLAGLQDLSLQSVTSDADEMRSRAAISKAIGFDENKLQVGEEDELQEEDPVIERVRLRGRKYRWMSMAAAACVLVIAGWFYWKERTKEELKHSVIANEIATGAGSKSAVHLPDGSVAILNAGSRLTYNKDFGINSREITLSGEAYFDIKKNPKIPLVVHTGTIDIWVKGTAFNVKAYPQDSTVEAALIRGAIEVVSKKDPERKILMRPKEKIVIGKLTTITSTASKGYTTKSEEEVFTLTTIKPDPKDSSYAEIAWLDNRLVFRSESFQSLARRMARWYNVEIVFDDAAVAQLVFTGSLEEENLTEALEALRISTPFDYTIENRKVVIHSNQ